LTRTVVRSDQSSLQSQLQSSQYYAHPALTRYFDHIQTATSVRKTADSLAPAFSLLSFDLDHAPKSERKGEPPKKKEKKSDNPPDTPVATKGKAKDLVAAAEVKSDVKVPKEKKEKKRDVGAADGKKTGVSGKGGVGTEDAGEPVPSMIDLRVGHIVDGKLTIAYICQSSC
jgi:aminoacyl tRNA synthase complex-interacting multifunctional protein 1